MPDPIADAAAGRRLVAGTAPEQSLVLERLWATARATPALAPELRDAIERTVTEANGLAGPAGPDAAPLDRSSPVLRFAEQFAVDVAGLTDEQRAALASALGPDAFTVAQAIWVLDIVGRTWAVLGALAPEPTGPTDPAAAIDVEPFHDLWSGIQALLDGVPALQAVDPVTTDLARLRLAGHHRCRLCRSLRSWSALAAGADDASYATVDGDDPDRSDAEQAALDLVDAFAWTPGHLGDDLVARVHATWSTEQQVELVLDAARNAANKLAVAFGADDPHVTDGIEVFDVAPDGTVTYGLTAPAS